MTIGRLIDVSSAQHGDLPPGQGPPIDWAQVYGAGVVAAFIKATGFEGGQWYVNPWFAIDDAAAAKAGILTVGYHFAGMSDPVAEAQFFAFHAGARARMLDLETSLNAPWALTFLQTLGLPRNELITYGSSSTLGQFYGRLPSMAFPAAYGQRWPGWGACWQFTSSASIPGIVGNVDEDQWHGDESQFESLFGLAQEGGSQVLAPTPTGNGYWTCSAQGAVITHGDAQYLGGPNTSNGPAWNGPPALQPGRKVVAITAHPSQQGYWVEDDIGEIFAYGAARYLPPN